jgi:hypothetical protein
MTLILEIAVQQEHAFWPHLETCRHIQKIACVSKTIRACLPSASRCVELIHPNMMISMQGLWRLVHLSRNQLKACSKKHGRHYPVQKLNQNFGVPLHIGIRAAEEAPGGLRQLMRAQDLERQALTEQRAIARADRLIWLEKWLSRNPNPGFYAHKLQNGLIPPLQHELRCRHFLDDHVSFELAVQDLQREYPADTYKHVVEERARHKLWIRLTKLGRRHWNHVVRMGGGVMAGFFCNL